MAKKRDNSKWKKARLKVLIKRLKSGKDVQQRDLEIVLTAEQFQCLHDKWQNEKVFRERFSEKPALIKEYEKLVNRAKMTYGKAEQFANPKALKKPKSNNGRKSVSRRLHDKAESQFESAIERLEEILSIDPNLRVWLDRDVDFITHGRGPSPDPICIPNVKTSRSMDNVSDGLQKTSKRDLKQEALEDALAAITQEENSAKKGISQEQMNDLAEATAKTRQERLNKLLMKIRRD